MDTDSSDRGNTKNPRSRRGELRKRGWMATSFSMTRTQIECILATTDCQYVFQRERCPKTQRLHFHIGIYFRNPRGIAFQDVWPEDTHWEWVQNWKKTKVYCSKVKTRVEGPWSNIEGLTWRRTIKDPMEGLTPFPWQEEILEIIKEEPDDRKVYWYYDYTGNTGKSCLAKHIRMWYKCCILSGTAKDCFCSLKLRLEDDDVDVVIFDLSRAQAAKVSYNAIEQIKNGMFFSGKYESGDVMMNPPHIIIFANFPPDMSMLSSDRWIINEIN